MIIPEFLKNTTTEETSNQEKVTLTLSGEEVHCLKDLREHFNMEEILKYMQDKTLVLWLNQHYYENEAHQLSQISLTQPDCKRKICRILGVAYEEHAYTEEEQKELEAKREKLKEFTEDENILKNAYIVAMNQEELANLIDHNEKKIYLCHNTFSIPISKTGIHYIGIAEATLENPYTKEQYEKAGITVEQIDLPKKENPDTVHLAKKAAFLSGYDDFSEKHTPLTVAIHKELSSRALDSFYRLPCDTSITTNFFTNKSECETARKRCIQKAYDEAERYFSLSSGKCVAKEAACFYSDWIEKHFTPLLDSLKQLCHMKNQDAIYEKIETWEKNCYKELKKSFEHELSSNRDFYGMYKFDYFLDQVEITTHDFRVSEGGFFKLMETAFLDNVQYTISDIYAPISEMETDLNSHATTFFKAAYAAYREHEKKLEEYVDVIGKDLPELKEKETIKEYLDRMIIENVK